MNCGARPNGSQLERQQSTIKRFRSIGARPGPSRYPDSGKPVLQRRELSHLWANRAVALSLGQRGLSLPRQASAYANRRRRSPAGRQYRESCFWSCGNAERAQRFARLSAGRPDRDWHSGGVRPFSSLAREAEDWSAAAGSEEMGLVPESAVEAPAIPA